MPKGTVFQKLARLLQEQHDISLDVRTITIDERMTTSTKDQEDHLHIYDECFMRLPSPLQDYTISPFRESMKDVHHLVEIMNHPLVYPTLVSPPYPYTEQDGIQFISSLLPGMRQWQDALGNSNTTSNLVREFRGDPMAILRYEPLSRSHLNPASDAAFKQVGQCIFRPYQEAADTSSAARTTASSCFESKQWIMGYALHPDHAGKGLMTACIKAKMALINTICALSEAESDDEASSSTTPSSQRPLKSIYRPKHRFHAEIYTENLASLKVVRKCGFEIIRKFQDEEGRKYGFRDGGKTTGAIAREHLDKDIWLYHLATPTS